MVCSSLVVSILILISCLMVWTIQVSEAKEVSAFAGQYKEAKRCRAYEAYEILAANITFATAMDKLLQPVLQRLSAATAPKLRNKLQLLLQAAAKGIRVNPSATAVDLAVWVEGSLQKCLAVEEAAQAAAKEAMGAATAVKRPVKRSGQNGQTVSAEGGELTVDQQQQVLDVEAVAAAAMDSGAAHLYLITEFTLTLLSSAVKKGVLSGRSPETLGLLDPLLPLLVRALACRHPGSVAVALRLLSVLVGLPLPGLDGAATAAGRALTKLLRQVPDAGHPIAQDCFRLLAGEASQGGT
jgi:U3 small nucleolar RNA-associated protein 20